MDRPQYNEVREALMEGIRTNVSEHLTEEEKIELVVIFIDIIRSSGTNLDFLEEFKKSNDFADVLREVGVSHWPGAVDGIPTGRESVNGSDSEIFNSIHNNEPREAVSSPTITSSGIFEELSRRERSTSVSKSEFDSPLPSPSCEENEPNIPEPILPPKVFNQDRTEQDQREPDSVSQKLPFTEHQQQPRLIPLTRSALSKESHANRRQRSYPDPNRISQEQQQWCKGSQCSKVARVQVTLMDLVYVSHLFPNGIENGTVNLTSSLIAEICACEAKLRLSAKNSSQNSLPGPKRPLLRSYKEALCGKQERAQVLESSSVSPSRSSKQEDVSQKSRFIPKSREALCYNAKVGGAKRSYRDAVLGIGLEHAEVKQVNLKLTAATENGECKRIQNNKVPQSVMVENISSPGISSINQKEKLRSLSEKTDQVPTKTPLPVSEGNKTSKNTQSVEDNDNSANEAEKVIPHANKLADEQVKSCSENILLSSVDIEDASSLRDVVDISSSPACSGAENSIESSSPEIGARKRVQKVIEASSDDEECLKEDTSTFQENNSEGETMGVGSKNDNLAAQASSRIERKQIHHEDYNLNAFGKLGVDCPQKQNKRENSATVENLVTNKQLCSSFRIPKTLKVSANKSSDRTKTLVDSPKENLQFERFRKGLSDKSRGEGLEGKKWSKKVEGDGNSRYRSRDSVQTGTSQTFRMSRETFEKHNVRRDRIVRLIPEGGETGELIEESVPLTESEPAWDHAEERQLDKSPGRAEDSDAVVVDIVVNNQDIRNENNQEDSDNISKNSEMVEMADITEEVEEDAVKNPEIPISKIEVNSLAIAAMMRLNACANPIIPDVGEGLSLVEATIRKIAWWISVSDFQNYEDPNDITDYVHNDDLDGNVNNLLRCTQSEDEEIYESLPEEKKRRSFTPMDEYCGRQLIVSQYRSGPNNKFSNIFQLQSSSKPEQSHGEESSDQQQQVYDKPTFEIRCALCNIWIKDKTELATHILSDSHKVKMSKAGLDDMKVTDKEAGGKNSNEKNKKKLDSGEKKEDLKKGNTENKTLEKKDKKDVGTKDKDKKKEEDKEKNHNKKRKRSKDRSSVDKSQDEAEVGVTSTGLPIKIPAGAIPEESKRRSESNNKRSRSPHYKRNRSRSPRHHGGRDKDRSLRRSRSRSPPSNRRRRSRSRSLERVRNRAREPVIRISRSPGKSRRRSTSTERIEKFLAKTQRRSRSPSNGYRKRHRQPSPLPITSMLPKKTNKEFHEKMALTVEGKWTAELEKNWKLMESQEAVFMEKFAGMKSLYTVTPESHPKYAEEWTAFWELRYQQIEEEGKEDPDKHDYVPEWKELWTKKLDAILDQEYEEGIKNLKIQFGVDIDTLQKLHSPAEPPVSLHQPNAFQQGLQPQIPQPVPPPACLPMGVPPPCFIPVPKAPSIAETVTLSSETSEDMTARSMSISDGDSHSGLRGNAVPAVTTVDVMSTWQKITSGEMSATKQPGSSVPVSPIRAHILPKDVLDKLNVTVYGLNEILDHPECLKRRPRALDPPEIPPPRQVTPPVNFHDTFTRPSVTSSHSSQFLNNSLRNLPEVKQKEIASMLTGFLISMGREDMSNADIRELLDKMCPSHSKKSANASSSVRSSSVGTPAQGGHVNLSRNSTGPAFCFDDNADSDPWRVSNPNMTRVHSVASTQSPGTAAPTLPNVVPHFHNPGGVSGPIRFDSGMSGWGRGQDYLGSSRTDSISSSSSGRHSPFSRRDFTGNPISSNPYRDKASNTKTSSTSANNNCCTDGTNKNTADGEESVVETVGKTNMLLHAKGTLRSEQETPSHDPGGGQSVEEATSFGVVEQVGKNRVEGGPSGQNSKRAEMAGDSHNLPNVPPGILHLIIQERNLKEKQKVERMNAKEQEESYYYRRRRKKKQRERGLVLQETTSSSSLDVSDTSKRNRGRSRKRQKRRKNGKNYRRSTQSSSFSPAQNDRLERKSRKTPSPLPNRRKECERRRRGRCRRVSPSSERRTEQRLENRSQVRKSSLGRLKNEEDEEIWSEHSDIIVEVIKRKAPPRVCTSEESTKEESRQGAVALSDTSSVTEPTKRRAPPRDYPYCDGQENCGPGPFPQTSRLFLRESNNLRAYNAIRRSADHLVAPSPPSSLSSVSSGHRRTKGRSSMTTVCVPGRHKLTSDNNWETLSEASSLGKDKRCLFNENSTSLHERSNRTINEKTNVTSVSKMFWTQKDDDAKSLSSISSHDASLIITTDNPLPKVSRNYRAPLEEGRESGELSISSNDGN